MKKRTTGSFRVDEIARILGCSVTPVHTLIDSGRLPAYRHPPTGRVAGERRVTREALIDFLFANNLPFDPADLGLKGIIPGAPDARRPGD